MDEIQRFLDDIDCLAPVMEYANRVNIFDILGFSKKEIRHSFMLVWFMDPKGNHGLGDGFLRRSIERTTQDRLSDYNSFEAKREVNNIDLLAVSKKEKYVFCIENKIKAPEHDDQLNRYKNDLEATYPDYKKVLVFLSPTGKEPSDPENWIVMGYREILEILEETVQEKELKPDADLLIRNYMDTIRRFVVKDVVIEKTCATIYTKHQKAIDRIWENRQNDALEKRIYEEHQAELDLIHNSRPNSWVDAIGDTIRSWAKDRTDEGKIKADLNNPSNRTIRFTTDYMTSILPDVEGGDSAWHTPNYYFYEIRNQQGLVYLQLCTGNMFTIPQKLMDMCDRISSVRKEDADGQHRIWKIAGSVSFDEYFEQEALVEVLDSFLEKVLEFERELMNKLEA